MTFPAFGVITGVVSEDAAIKPGGRVACLDRETMEVVDTVVTDQYGVYRFEFLDTSKKYLVLAVDDDSVNTNTPGSTPPSGRYLRLIVGMNSGDNGYKGMVEVEVASTAGGADITTTGTPVTATAYVNSDAPSRLVDNNASNGWYVNNYVLTPYVVIDLGSSQPVHEVRIQSHNTYAYVPRELVVQLSDDAVRWDTVAIYADPAAWTAGGFKTIVLGPRPDVTTYNSDAKNAVVADHVVPVEGYRDWDGFYRALLRVSPNLADITFFDHHRMRMASLAGVSNGSNDLRTGIGTSIGARLTTCARRTQSALPSPYYPHDPGAQRTLITALGTAWSAHASYTILAVVDLPHIDDVVLLGSLGAFCSDAFMTPHKQGLAVSRRSIVARHTISNDTNNMKCTTHAPAAPLPEKFMVTMVVTGATKVELFVDDTLVATTTHTNGVSSDSNSDHSYDVMLSARRAGARPVAVSCVARFPAALSAAQVAALHTARTAVPSVVPRTFADTVKAMRPIHYLKLDNADPALMTDEMLGGVLTKSTAGTLTAATEFTPGVPALTFSGAWVRPINPFPVMPGGNGLGVLMWLRMAALPGGTITLAGVFDASGNRQQLSFGLTAAGKFSITPGGSGGWTLDAPALSINTDYMVLVQAHTDAEYGPCTEVFVNGVLAQRLTYHAGANEIVHNNNADTNRLFTVGAARASGNGVNAPFSGTLGHAALFNRSLSAEEVATLYAARAL